VSKTGGCQHSEAARTAHYFVVSRQQSESRVLKLLLEEADRSSICVHSLSGLQFHQNSKVCVPEKRLAIRFEGAGPTKNP
jgi:hypothetical protein